MLSKTPDNVTNVAFSDLLTSEEAAGFLGLSAKTLATWRSTGRHALTFVKVGGRVRYRRQDLEAWLAGRMQEHTGQAMGMRL
ncbi:helix-turn-helix domain-containing protein [Billgrantia desiderata]|uniref:helix-turn-helix domain-containing protein n=1 Tax=Billgrantia desiderata TaxID=52021 RepID=UPI003F3F4341